MKVSVPFSVIWDSNAWVLSEWVEGARRRTVIGVDSSRHQYKMSFPE
jgi:hypothetical protein